MKLRTCYLCLFRGTMKLYFMRRHNGPDGFSRICCRCIRRQK